MAVDSNYEKLKEDIIKECCNSRDLEVLKKGFENDITSKRALKRITSVKELIDVLEERDCVSEKCVSCFDVFANLLQRKEIKDLIYVYRKLYGEENEKCEVCRKDVIFASEEDFKNSGQLHEVLVQSSPTVLYSEDAQGYLPLGNNSSYQTTELNRAIDNVCPNLQKPKLWATIARILDLTEEQIDAIRKTNPGDIQLQAGKALLLWKREQGANASTGTLIDALNNRLCKREGLGPNLIERRLDANF